MEKQLDDQLAEEIRALVREENLKLLTSLRAIREENTQFISALSEGLGQAMRRYTNEADGVGVSSGADTHEQEPAVADHEPVEMVNTKGIHKKTIKAAELVGQILQERGDMRLSEIAEEVERRGGDFGANATITMKSIMKVVPAIRKVRRGRYAYEPEQREENA